MRTLHEWCLKVWSKWSSDYPGRGRRIRNGHCRASRPQRIEPLEIRVLLAIATWTGNGDGTSWSQDENWSANIVPDASSDVIINVASGTTIQGPTIPTTIKSLVIESGSLRLSSAIEFTSTESIRVHSSQSLTIAGTILQTNSLSVTDGTLSLSSGTIRNTVIATTVGSSISMSGGILDAVTVNGTFRVINGVILRNGLTLNGTASLGDPNNLGVYGVLACQGSQTIHGTGTIDFASTNVQNAVTQQTADATITFGTGITIRGKTGSLGYTPQQFSDPSTIIINKGKILWEAETNILIPKLMINEGTLNYTSQAVVNVQGPVRGGVIQTETGAKVVGIGASCAWEGVTLNGNLQIINGIVLRNGLTLNGTIALGDPNNLSVYGALACQGTQAIAGSGTIDFISTNIQNAVTQQADDASIIFGSGITVRGKTGSLGYTPQQFSAPTAVVINQGMIIWDAETNILIPKLMINQGTLYFTSQAVVNVQGPVQGGVIQSESGARIVGVGASCAWEGVTVNGRLQIINGIVLRDGLTLNGTIELGDPNNLSVYGALACQGPQTIDGDGTIEFISTNGQNAVTQQTADASITFGSGITVRGKTGSLGYTPSQVSASTAVVINEGTIRWDADTNIEIPRAMINRGILLNTTSAPVRINGPVEVDGTRYLASTAGSTFIIDGSITGATTAAGAFINAGEVRILGGTPAVPRLVEAMSLDRGIAGASASANFAFNVLRLGTGAQVKLIDENRNSVGVSSEVVYLNTLVVAAGATLDLNGITVYARSVQVDGSIVGGTISAIPDSGPLILGAPIPGKIAVPGEVDQWTFFARSGKSVSILVNPSATDPNPALVPQLDRAQLSILNSAGTVIATADNETTGGVISLMDVPLNSDGTYRIQVRSAPGLPNNTGHYTLAAYDVTADVGSTTLGSTVVGAIETPFGVDRWKFSASQNQQVRFQLKAASNSDLTFTLTGPNGFTAFADATTTSDLVSLPATGEYQVTARSRNGVTGNYSFQLIETTVTALPLGQTVSATHGGTGSVQLFRVSVPEGKPMVIRMDDSAANNANILYAKLGAPPTLRDYDFATVRPRTGNVDTADVKGSADPTLLVPKATAGDWYILVYGNVAPTVGGFTIQATSANVVLNGVSPSEFGANNTVELGLSGAGFVPGATVQLLASGNAVVASTTDTQVNSFTSLSANLSLSGVSPGIYGVRIILPDGSNNTLSNAFTVRPRGVPNLEVRLTVPGTLARTGAATITVEYANTGTAAMAAPLLRLQSADPEQDEFPILSMDQSGLAAALWTDGVRDGFGRSVQILASGATPGILNPGERFSVPIAYVGIEPPWINDGLIEFEVRSFESTNTDTIPWSTLENELRPTTISAEAWNPIFDNLTANVGATWGDFVRMLSDNARYLNRLGQRVVDVADLWSFEVQQAIGFSPLRTLASSVDAAVTTTGSDLSFGRFWSLSLDQRSETSQFGRGWSTPWQTRMTVEANGSVNIFGAGGSRRRFQPDIRFVRGDAAALGSTKSYFSDPGETGMLLKFADGTYEVREQNGSVTRFNAAGRLAYAQDPNGNRISMSYDGSGRLSTLTHSGGQFISLAYNGAGLIRSLTDSTGHATNLTYDASNQYLLTATGPDGVVTTYTYDTTPNSPKQHALTSVTTGDVTQLFQYDGRGRLSSTATKLSPTTETGRINFSYDTAGRVSVSDAAGGTTNLFYDHRGLITKVSDPFGNVTTTEYGDDLRISRIVDPLGESQAFTWCGCGSLTSSTDQSGHKTAFKYDNVGPNGTLRRMTSFTDANGNTTRYTYDSKGNLTSTIYPNGSVERTTQYDPFGDPLTFINRRGQVMGYTYNAAGQVTRQTFDDGSFIDLTYDSRGNLATVTEPGNKVTTYSYDTGDRLTKVLYPQGRFLEFTYDAAGRRSTMTDQLGYVLRYSYDAAGRLFQLRDTANTLIVEYLYDVAGRLRRKNNGNNTYTEYDYDIAGQILSIFNRAPNGSVNGSFVYTYDVLGRRTSMTTTDGKWVYGYDPKGQLTSAVFTPVVGSPIPAQDLQYVYDPLGNRIRTIENGVTTNYTKNNLNQYTQVGSDTLIYDADGNLISRFGPSGNATYSYDQESRLIRVVTPDGSWLYEYDAFGNRTATSLDGIRTEYLLDPSGLVDVVGEYTSMGSLTARYLHGLGLVMADRPTETGRMFYEFDAIGNTVAASLASGTQIGRIAYTPFGRKMLSSPMVAGAFQFGGQFGVRNEENGLYFMRARYFVLSVERFVSVRRRTGCRILAESLRLRYLTGRTGRSVVS